VGVCLLTVRRVFRGEVPTVAAFAERERISVDTISRTARMLLFKVARLLKRRRPGPRQGEASADAAAPKGLAALQAINAILKSLLPAPVAQLLSSPARRGMVVQQALHWQAKGVPLEETAGFVGISMRTLRRWIKRCKEEGGGQEVPLHDRRPQSSPAQVPQPIRDALLRLRHAFPDLSAAELTRVFNSRFGELLAEHGRQSLTAKTVGRYLVGSAPEQPHDPQGSTRGEYRYPPALTMAWVDTTQLEVAGVTVHIVGAMEASSRIAICGDAFAEENSEVTGQVLALSLARIPGLCAVVRDRGTPYLNAKIDALLGSCGVLAINAYPHFPIDKAALERFWGTLKSWLTHALKPFADRCREEGRSPGKDEVVAVVRPALRVFLRAYNLIPMPHLDGSSPLERIAALLRGDAEPGFSIADFRKLAIERETKDELLIQVRDALQIDRSIAVLRSDFAMVSKIALQRAIQACAKKLVIERDRAIYAPYRYLLAVAKIKEREWQEEHAKQQRQAEDARRRLEEETRQEQALRNEREAARARPEDQLTGALRQWVQWFRHPIAAMARSTTARLVATLASIRLKIGDAFEAQVAATHALLPRLVATLRPGDGHLADQLALELTELAIRARRQEHPGTSGAGPPPGQAPSSPAFSDQVRQALGDLLRPHVRRTDVSP